MAVRWIMTAFVCFFLPWVEIRCESRAELYGKRGEDGTVRVSQSGMQMAYGGYSRTVTPPDKWVTEKGRGRKVSQPTRAAPGDPREKVEACPLLAVYGVALAAALALLLVAKTRRRALAARAAVGVAAGCLLLQTAFGLPLWRRAESEGGRTYVPAPFVARENYCAFTIWFWISWAAVAGAGVCALRSSLPPAEPQPSADDAGERPPPAGGGT